MKNSQPKDDLRSETLEVVREAKELKPIVRETLRRSRRLTKQLREARRRLRKTTEQADIALASAVLITGGSRTLHLSLPADAPVQLVTFHTNSDGVTRPHEVTLQPSSSECRRLREWLAHNQDGWRQPYAATPPGGIFVHAGNLHMEFVDTTVVVFIPGRHAQKTVREGDYAFLKAAAGI